MRQWQCFLATLAMHHRLHGMLYVQAEWLQKGQEHSGRAYMVYGHKSSQVYTNYKQTQFNVQNRYPILHK